MAKILDFVQALHAKTAGNVNKLSAPEAAGALVEALILMQGLAEALIKAGQNLDAHLAAHDGRFAAEVAKLAADGGPGDPKDERQAFDNLMHNTRHTLYLIGEVLGVPHPQALRPGSPECHAHHAAARNGQAYLI